MKQEEAVDKKIWIAFICMVFGMFMAVLDIQIVASSLEEIQGGLSATRDEINWVQSAYLIAEVVIIPLSGWLTRAFSTRIVFAISCAGFSIMSLACAMAWDLQSMIVFRAMQGFLGGSMIPTVFATIFRVFPLRLRPTVIVVLGLVVTIAPATGPVIGGYITNYLSWHYLFLINIIPGILVTIAVLRLVNFDKPDFSLLKNIDFLGIILISISLGSLQYILEEGVRMGWFQSTLICNLAIASAVSMIAMLYRELTVKNPIINLYAFKDFNFSCSCLLSFALGWALFSTVFMMPVFLSYSKGFNSLQIGEYVWVMGAFQLLSGPCAGFMSKRVDLRFILAFGMVLLGIGLIMNYNITNNSSFEDLFWPQMVRGFALIFCFLPITTLAFATLPPEAVPTASGLYSLMRNLGGAIGLAVTNTWLQNWSKENYLPLREAVDATNQLSNDTLSVLEQQYNSLNYADASGAAIQTLYATAQREAYIITFNQVSVHLGLLLFLVAICIVFIKKPNLKMAGKPAGE